MAQTTTIDKIRLGLRIHHNKLDDDISVDIDACLADLNVVGVIYADEADPLIFNAIKLWCRALYTDDMNKSVEYQKRYNALKACLMMAEGYGWKDELSE